MHEPMTTQLVAEQLQKLLAAFPRNLGQQNPAMMADVYRNGLRGLDGEAFRAAVDIAIQNDSYFPKVARLRELTTEWTRRNRATFAVQQRGSWDVCGVCGARAMLAAGQRQMRDDKGVKLWEDAEGKIPRMEPSPERWAMRHLPGPHGVKSEEAEIDHAAD